jgi:adenylate cyclase
VQAGDLAVGLQVSSNDEVGVLASGVNAMAAALREKERILATFGRVVEPAIRDRLLAGDLQLRGELRSASVLFCDLRGFTAIAEQSPPAEVLATLNDFFAKMTGWVRECGGFVDKFIGDSLLVVFGLFSADDDGAQADSARAALRCALGMHERLHELNAARGSAARPPLQVAIGVHSGELVAGTIGAQDRHEYTIIGDTVNVAARLEQLCKASGHRLLVSESTYELARNVGFEVELQPLEVVQLRGRRQPIRVFGLPQG